MYVLLYCIDIKIHSILSFYLVFFSSPFLPTSFCLFVLSIYRSSLPLHLSILILTFLPFSPSIYSLLPSSFSLQLSILLTFLPSSNPLSSSYPTFLSLPLSSPPISPSSLTPYFLLFSLPPSTPHPTFPSIPLPLISLPLLLSPSLYPSSYLPIHSSTLLLPFLPLPSTLTPNLLLPLTPPPTLHPSALPYPFPPSPISLWNTMPSYRSSSISLTMMRSGASMSLIHSTRMWISSLSLGSS